jgi:succinate dehydrogenase flavin-adding protein (antitoxin of CptAB toxin-antitoxin module)
MHHQEHVRSYKFLDVSDQSVYNWEHKRAAPRKEQLAALATIRTLGKREARARLEAMVDTRVRKPGEKSK